MLDRGALELGRGAAHEIADAHVPAPLFALDHHSRRRLLAPVPNEPETDPHCIGINRSLLPDVNASEDRKSTRLNSSHLVISYAVFCLKKKKTKHIRARLLVT